eukprot:CAMPEP_0194048552 /NCGR_PEP_ID=MMETSP0009_2-20130614/27656_1 /TAXON_ID=210454 /ORGANISM="Grammatophora oceanica, Strain CCMP 410" /LENGTH=330 /DNA_ID=CAMNT_0038694459 /DNA_START=48 /DNA_END=1040 /DNA_ORIENTATION=+
MRRRGASTALGATVVLLLLVCSCAKTANAAAADASFHHRSSSSPSLSNKKKKNINSIKSPAFLTVPNGGGGAKAKAAKKEVVDKAKKAAKKLEAALPTPTSSSNNSILSFPKDHPFAFQLMIATVKTAAADLLVQVVTDGKSFPTEVDWKRNAIFVVFGCGYLGCFQYFLMVNKYRQWFPTMDSFGKKSFQEKLQDTDGLLDAMKMVLFDLIVHLPLMYFPTYYAIKECVSGETLNPLKWITTGLSKYYTNSQEDLLAMIQLWGPSDCVQFALPTHVRMPFRHLVSFFWTAYVSFTRGAIAVSTDGGSGAAAVVEAVAEAVVSSATNTSE